MIQIQPPPLEGISLSLLHQSLDFHIRVLYPKSLIDVLSVYYVNKLIFLMENPDVSIYKFL